MRIYILKEPSFDTAFYTEERFILAAQLHCKSFEDRKDFLPIETAEAAIKYFTCNGFDVTVNNIALNKDGKLEITGNMTTYYKKEMKKEHTYYVTFSLRGQYVAKVVTTETDAEKIKELASENFDSADFGEMKNIDGEPVLIENEDGDFSYP